MELLRNSSTSSWRPRVELPLLQSSSSLCLGEATRYGDLMRYHGDMGSKWVSGIILWYSQHMLTYAKNDEVMVNFWGDLLKWQMVRIGGIILKKDSGLELPRSDFTSNFGNWGNSWGKQWVNGWVPHDCYKGAFGITFLEGLAVDIPLRNGNYVYMFIFQNRYINHRIWWITIDGNKMWVGEWVEVLNELADITGNRGTIGRLIVIT